MFSRILLALIVLLLPHPSGLAGQGPGSSSDTVVRPSAAAAFRPSAASAVLALGRTPAATRIPASPPGEPSLQMSDEEGHLFLLELVLLSAASLGGLWAGAQLPFPPADDDSDFSAWHLATAPTASIASASGVSLLLGHDLSTSLKSSAIGATAGAVVGVLASTVMETDGALVVYAGVHGLVAALLARRAS